MPHQESLNPLGCGLGFEEETDDATDVSESWQVGLNGGLPGGEKCGSITYEEVCTHLSLFTLIHTISVHVFAMQKIV